MFDADQCQEAAADARARLAKATSPETALAWQRVARRWEALCQAAEQGADDRDSPVTRTN